MNVHLMYRDRDLDLTQPPVPNEAALVQDLALSTLIAAMSAGDDRLAKVIRPVLLASTTDVVTIRYRQAIVRDCFEHEDVVRAIYNLAVDTTETKRRDYYFGIWRSPNGVLHSSASILEMLARMLKELRVIAEQHGASFASEGFTALFTMLRAELDDAYLETIHRHLQAFSYGHSVFISARLDAGNKGVAYTLRKETSAPGNWLSQWFGAQPEGYSFRLHPRDESGARALSELEDHGIEQAAEVLSRAADHILGFFTLLREELAFYIGCMNLRRQLAEREEPICFPQVSAAHERRYVARGLYDVCLALNLKEHVVGNDVKASGKRLVMITGANQGGKSTFLRSVGLSQLMMQCGMFVPATAFDASVCTGLFTHYKREEDVTMSSGKFDEELARMSAIVDHLQPDALVLFNESFAATNEREGSEIAREIVTALIEHGITVFFVTHQYAFAHGMQSTDVPPRLFLRAQRQPDGSRTFKIVEGAPEPSSHGLDLYRKVFSEAPHLLAMNKTTKSVPIA